jgi:hypothetical protein
VEVTGRKKRNSRIDLFPTTIQSWFRPLNLKKDIGSGIPNPDIGSGIPNALWSDDKIPTLNNIKGIPIVCGDGRKRIFFPYSHKNFIYSFQGEYNHLGNDYLLR